MFASLISLTLVSHAWFSHNRDTAVINPIIINKGKFDYDFSAKVNGLTLQGGNIVFDNIYPGAVHKNNINLSLENIDEKDYYTSFYFAAPNANDEIPYIDEDNNHYYLGSQIQITKLDILVNGVAPTGETALNKFLVTTSNDAVTKGQNNSVPNAVSPIGDLFIIEDVLVPMGHTITLDIDFTFVDNGTNQNVYKDLWPTVGKSMRSLKVHIWSDNEWKT